MRNMDESLIITRTLSYLGSRGEDGALALSDEIRQCVEELGREARFRSCHEIYTLKYDEEGYPYIPELDFPMKSEDLKKCLAGSKSICVISYTLGIETDRYLKRVSAMSLSHGLILDTTASAYLEELADLYDEAVIGGVHTFRYAPGYGDVPLEWNVFLANAIRCEKRIGVTHSTGGLFLPRKSMLGLIGIGQSGKKIDCSSCARFESCTQRKEGMKCFQ